MSKFGDLQRQCVCNIDDLEKYLSFTDSEKKQLKEITERYPIKITPYYLGLLDREDPKDPLRKLCIPAISEQTDDGEEDTSGEARNTVIKGMQHKYRQTVLILSTNNCATYCRHCFRKRMVGCCENEVADDLEKMADYVSSHKEIKNVLISGGDAFALENGRIREYLEVFSNIENVKLIRFGTRVPVVMPQRIYEDGELLEMLKSYGSRIQLAVVTQFDHPREITFKSRHAISSLIGCGAFVRNQSVLLRGINDDPDTMAELMNSVTATGAIPYYIFQCRPVLGVKNHFQVPLHEGAGIIKSARSRMNGQARCFRYVLSHPSGKIEIIGMDGEDMIFRYHEAKEDKDQGRLFRYRPGDDKCWLDRTDIPPAL